LGSPAVFGVWRVRLLFPEILLYQLSQEELRMVFLHELAHVRRADLLLNWLLMLVQFLHWFNPLVWLALHRLREDRELVCDAVVLQNMPRWRHLEYGHLLIKLVQMFSGQQPVFAGAIPVAGSRQGIKRRLWMIRSQGPASSITRLATVLLAVGLGCVTLTRAREEKTEATTEPMIVRIDRDGVLYLGSEKAPATIDLLKQVLRSARTKAPGMRLMVRADKNAPYASIVRVMDAAKGTEIATVTVSTSGWAVPSAVNQRERSEDAERPGSERTQAGATNAEASGSQSLPMDAGERTSGRPRAIQEAVAKPVRQKRESPVVQTNSIVKIEITCIGPSLADDSVRSNITLRVGDVYVPSLVDDDVRRLYATGRFYNIRVASAQGNDGLTVTYIVQYKPTLTEIKFGGNAKIPQATLLQKLESKMGEPFDERKAFRDGEKIKQLYEAEGYSVERVVPFSEVDEQSGQAKLTFKITGPQ
jgi:biopolymer transport protein ExbD